MRLELTDHEKKNSVNSSNFRVGDSWIDPRQTLRPDYPINSASMGEKGGDRESIESPCAKRICKESPDG